MIAARSLGQRAISSTAAYPPVLPGPRTSRSAAALAALPCTCT